MASVASYLIGGFLPGSALAATTALVFAALLIGRTALVIVFAFFMVLVIALTIGISTDLWHGPDFLLYDARDPKNWIRTSFVSITIWGVIGFSVTFVIGTIEKNLAYLRKEMAERRVAEKARRDAETVANHAQKMEAVGQLAASIAHDFNNALLVIKGWNEIRGKADADDRQRKATEAIERATEHSAQLGRQLLTFARKDIRTPKLLYLDRLVGAMTESLRHLVGPHIQLCVDTQPDVSVFADETQLHQMIFNLIINARDALGGSGNVRISVGVASANEITAFDPDQDRYAILTVEDDGPGIEQTIQERVFDPFFTTKVTGKGSGLGLTAVSRIAEQSGGHVDMQSRPGQTRFSVFLPAAEKGLTELPGYEKQADTTELGLRVLVLEDDPRARNLIASALTLNGNEVLECDNGDAAVTLLEGDLREYDLLCTDAVFPGEQFGDVVAAFQRHSPDGKILICSGYVQEELAIRKLESGEYGFLAKPFTGSELIARIRNIVA
jgi:signal transduction histidine kinase